MRDCSGSKRLQMIHKIIDTNVPLTAAGRNPQATSVCVLNCGEIISRILKGEIVVVVDVNDSAIAEYRNNMYPDPNGTPAGQFLMYLLTNKNRSRRVKSVSLALDENGQFEDYPDSGDTWTTGDVRCKRFDLDDKKWVALARRFRLETQANAPIVNAADQCWIAFEPQLESAGVKLETLCRDER